MKRAKSTNFYPVALSQGFGKSGQNSSDTGIHIVIFQLGMLEGKSVDQVWDVHVGSLPQVGLETEDL